MGQCDRRAGAEGGYTLVGVLILVVVVNVALSVAMVSWRSIDTRAREAELIWRGEAIARAIVCHGAAEGAAPLERLEQLVESNCLRRLAPDPMTSDGEWRVLRRSDLTEGTIATLLGQPGPDAEGASTSPVQRPPALAAGLGVSSANEIIGVMSRHRGKAIRVYRTFDQYERWVFLGEESDS